MEMEKRPMDDIPSPTKKLKSEPLFEEEWCKINAGELVITWYFFPTAASKRVDTKTIKGIYYQPQNFKSEIGVTKNWGKSFSPAWWACDMKRGFRSHADERGFYNVVVDVGDGTMKAFTTANLRALLCVLRQQCAPEVVVEEQLRATSVFLAELVETSDSSTKIKKITELSYFEYYGSDARVCKFHGIGDYDEPTFWLLPHEIAPMNDVEPNARDDDIVTPNRPDPFNPDSAPKQSLFYCRDCGSSFIRYTNLLKHIERGKHFIRPEHIKLLDRELGLFMRAIEDTLVPVPLSPLPHGLEIRHERKVGRYSETTKAFVKAKFDEYAKCGAKLKADEVEIQMRADRFMEPNDLMTKSQLRNYINTLKSQPPKTRVWRRQVEHEEEEMDDEHFVVEVEPSEEDIFLTENNFHHYLTPTKLKKFFTDVHNPVYPNTPVPAGATEFD
ncbi:hypothetical protein PRIPAC_77872 [Pristionchus pacificus]|uniref:NAD(P)H-hydrate epimerase n=1 Tax=Pristionchus pacificus TaxID=54126 RepID=A0A2A6CPB6_PRIPA|nr:hypothetical protein PRIPAC_77872 [Pristionchus pacificus]|eukprot:PDM79917.1 hypothetical protein PRIPAC_32496 [Pristionchus pacificus]